MFRLVVVLLAVCVAGLAFASDADRVGNTVPFKSDSHVNQYPGPGTPVQGGDTIFDAWFIGGLPYDDSGTTAGYFHDYDEACPYTGSTSPDVVYAYIPPTNQAITVDLCGSGYDTKVYVYDAGLNLLGCNDDAYFGPPCGLYVSKVENVPVSAGNIHYIIIDGYGGDYGQYVMHVEEYAICDLVCQGEAEGEPTLGPGYIDSYNGGCNSTPWVFQTVEATDEPDCTTLCGVSGWYDGNTRDTDWFEVIAIGTSITWTVDSEYACNMFVILPDCNNIQIPYNTSCGPCFPSTITWPTSPGEIYWLWVGPTIFDGPQIEFEYIMDVCGIYGTVPTENTSWGQVKELYK